MRCIDDFARSGVNGTTSVGRKIRMGTIRDMVAIVQRMKRKFPRCRVKLVKTDF